MRRSNFDYPTYLSFPSTIGADGTRPTTTTGTAVTPGASNTYGASYTSLGVLDATKDVYWIDVIVHSSQGSGQARSIMIKLAADPAGGTAFVDFWNGILTGSQFIYVTNAFGYTRIRMPYYLKAGTSLGVKAASLNATVTDIYVFVNGMGTPSNDNVPVGRKITTFGVTEPTVAGTAVTPGTTSEGSWTRIGATSFAGNEFFLNIGASVNDTSLGTNTYYIDVAIGDGTNFVQVIRDLPIMANSLEALYWMSDGVFIRPKAGENVYVRAQTSGALDTNFSVAIFAVS